MLCKWGLAFEPLRKHKTESLVSQVNGPRRGITSSGLSYGLIGLVEDFFWRDLTLLLKRRDEGSNARLLFVMLCGDQPSACNPRPLPSTHASALSKHRSRETKLLSRVGLGQVKVRTQHAKTKTISINNCSRAPEAIHHKDDNLPYFSQAMQLCDLNLS